MSAASAWITNRSAHIFNRSITGFHTQAEIDRVGLFGECAVAKMLGLPLSSCGMLLKGERMDAGHDLVDSAGYAIQVKAIQLRYKDYPNAVFEYVLETGRHEEFTADFGVLVLLLKDKRRARIAGYTTPEVFQSTARITDLGSGPRLGVLSNKLLPMTDWIRTSGGQPAVAGRA